MAERLGVAVPAATPEELRSAASPAGCSADAEALLARAHAPLWWALKPAAIEGMDASQLPLFCKDRAPALATSTHG